MVIGECEKFASEVLVRGNKDKQQFCQFNFTVCECGGLFCSLSAPFGEYGISASYFY